MKRTLGLAAVVFVGGVWAGFSAWPSASVMTSIQAGLALVTGANLVFCLWLWHRAQPGSGDAMVLPTVALLSVAMLLGILPRVFWPAAESLRVAGSIAGMLVVTVVVVLQIRNWRRLRRVARPG